MDEPEKNFFYSKGNEYSLVDRNQNSAAEKALVAAQALAHVLQVAKYYPESQRTLRILGKDYQALTIKFTNSFGETCAPEISVPLDFSGQVRIWTNNRESKRVWSTIEKIEAARCNPVILFKFIAQRFNEFSADFDDDIPF
ncbi:MAG: hypothetical protein EOM12_13970 [Verrucomicrobiae bacterium]|nr:hypothetical protein [Verrucomicrobiae bacterium]